MVHYVMSGATWPLATLTRAETTDGLPGARRRLAPTLTLLFVNGSGSFSQHGSLPRHLNKNTTRSVPDGGFNAEEPVSVVSACQRHQRPSVHSREIRAIRVLTALQVCAAPGIQSLWGANAANPGRIQPCTMPRSSSK